MTIQGKTRLTRVVLIGLVSGLALSCGAGDENPGGLGEAIQLSATSYSLTIKTPSGVSFVDLALAANEHLELEESSSVRSQGSALPTISSVGDEGAKLETSVAAGNVYTKATLVLESKVHVSGSVFAGGLNRAPSARVDGTVTVPANLQPLTETTFSVDFPAASAPSVVVNRRRTHSIPPGRYSHAVVKGTLQLTSGSYYFDSLDVEQIGTLELEQHAGPTVVFIKDSVSLMGTTLSHHGNWAIVQVSSHDLQVPRSFQGAIAAPNAKLILGDSSDGHDDDHSHQGSHWYSWNSGGYDHRDHDDEHDSFIGAFYAQRIRVGARDEVVYEPPNALASVVSPPHQDVEACTRLIRPPPDVPAGKQDAAFQTAVAQNCTMLGRGACDTANAGRGNVDYSLAALRMLRQTIDPGHYLAVVRDRSRKLRKARHDSTFASELCSGPDTDGDWIPDNFDQCPGTTELTATDDNGCPTNVIPAAPSADAVHQLVSAMNMPFKDECAGATMPPRTTAGAFYRPANPALGSYILATRAEGQPVGCPVWYEFDIQIVRPTVGALSSYSVAFKDTDETTDMVGLGIPVPPGVIQFNPLPTDAGTRALLAGAGGTGVRFRVRAMNGAGVRSGWSEWRLTTKEDCLALGFTCGG